MKRRQGSNRSRPSSENKYLNSMEKVSLFEYNGCMKQGYFFDMDGTLYDNAFHSISEKTFSILHRLQESNHGVFLITSRSTSELANLPYSMRTFSFDVIISDGGALIVDKDKEILRDFPLDIDFVNTIQEYCRAHSITWRYSTKKENFFDLCTDIKFHQIMFDLYLNAPLLKTYQNEKAYNLLIFFETQKQKEDLLKLCSGQSLVLYPDCLEVRAPRVDKSEALDIVKKMFSLETVVCFGDGENDVDMLKKADLGVAMGNGVPCLKEAADVVIGRVDEDGIYKYLKEKESLWHTY